MALDGIYLSRIKNEIEQSVLGSRVDKISQSSKHELIFHFRAGGKNHRLLISAGGSAAGIYFIEENRESMPVPTMFLMLLRKHLSGAVLKNITQLGLDRVLTFEFSAFNTIGERVEVKLCVEIMGTYSNIILIDSSGNIIDSLKRIDLGTSNARHILPKIKYELPQTQNKLNILQSDSQKIIEAILQKGSSSLSKAALAAIEGISPIVAREIAYYTTQGDKAVEQLTQTDINMLLCCINELKTAAAQTDEFYIIKDSNQKCIDISFIKIYQYGKSINCQPFSSPSMALEEYYSSKNASDSSIQRTKELRRAVSNAINRISKKLTNQRAELEESANKEVNKLYGELITNNARSLRRGDKFYVVCNYYDSMNEVKIPVDPSLSPIENANKYYKKYRKLKIAESMLNELISAEEEELRYLDSVEFELDSVKTEAEAAAIREELLAGGYIKKHAKKKIKSPKLAPPMEFKSSDGFVISVGRNNVQNDSLSLKMSQKSDLWFHTQSFAGSHVVVKSGGKNIPNSTVEQAAIIAATFSKAQQGNHVAVDYTLIKNLKKPSGAKPGKVIYHEYQTLIVNPDMALANRLKVK